MAAPPRSRTAAGRDRVEPHYLGHRERLRERLLAGGTSALPDYELLEFLLYAARPRGDTKPLAKALIARFGSLAAVLGAERDALIGVDGMGEASAAALLAVREAGVRLLRAEVLRRHVISSWQQLLDYLTASMSRKNALIADERQQRGTVDHVPVYPREVVKRALELGASAVIMVHNHPSGDTTPSKGDIEMTKAVAKALAAVDLIIHDHVIIGRGRHASFKSLGLL